MNNELIGELISQIRADYQIPPYHSSETIKRSIDKCAARLKQLNPMVNFATDEVGRGLLRDFVYYDFTKQYEEFEERYQSAILAWQLSQEVDDVSE